MSATLTSSSLLQIPPLQGLKKLSISTSFLHGSTPLSFFSKPSTSPSPPQTLNFLPSIRAMRTLQGRVVCATSDKTVAVEVVRLAPHPKYKRRIRIKKKYQAHDPDNKFKVGDFVELEKCRPISKMKTFLAIPVPPRNSKQKVAEPVAAAAEELGIPLESQQQGFGLCRHSRSRSRAIVVEFARHRCGVRQKCWAEDGSEKEERENLQSTMELRLWVLPQFTLVRHGRGVLRK